MQNRGILNFLHFWASMPYLYGGWCNGTNVFWGKTSTYAMIWIFINWKTQENIPFQTFIWTRIICVVVHHKCFLSLGAFLVCIQTQGNIAFLTFPSRHTLWIEVASPLLVTVKCPLSQVVIMHIWLWFVLLESWGIAFLLRWRRARWLSANYGCWLVDLVQTVGNCQAKPFERHWFLVQ